MRVRPSFGFFARLRAAIDSDASGLRQALAALLVSSGGDLLAGLTLGAITGTLEELPGLLVLVPAAIGMRGNIFGALGSRFGTSIHTGTFRLSRRTDTVVGQNILAAAALTLAISAALAVLAKTIASAFGVSDTISLADFFVISIVGGVLSSIVVLALTLGVAALGGAARLGHGQRRRTSRHRGGRHGHVAEPVPGHLSWSASAGSRSRSPRSVSPSRWWRW